MNLLLQVNKYIMLSRQVLLDFSLKLPISSVSVIENLNSCHTWNSMLVHMLYIAYGAPIKDVLQKREEGVANVDTFVIISQ